MTSTAADPLPSWREGPTKQAILSFVAKVSEEGSPAFIPPAERIAVVTTTAPSGRNNRCPSRQPLPSMSCSGSS